MSEATHDFAVERRTTITDSGRRAQVTGALALAGGTLLLIPSAIWILDLLNAVLLHGGDRRMLLLVGVPSVLLLVAVVLVHFGFGCLRGAVTWLDRRGTD